jgi:hypothetical protein
MDNVITTREGFNGPLGEVQMIEGPEAMQLFRLITLKSALRFNMKTGMKITRGYSLKLVKQTTGLKTNNKHLHMLKLDEMIEAQRAKVNYVREA